jgi:hypothetical protein
MFSREMNMQDEAVVSGIGLSQGERLIDTFVAPSKTFTDILRNSSWWLPFVFMVLVGFVFSVAIDKKVGFESVAQHELEKNAAASAQISALPADQRAARMAVQTKITKYITYGYAVPILIVAALASLVLWASFNFGLGAKTTFGQVFAVWMYAALPKSLMALLAAVLLFAGVNTETFDIRNPAGTNLAYYMPDASAGLKALLSFFDIFGLWSLALLVIGTAIIARKSTGQAAAVVVGWWVLILLITAGFAAAFG